LVIGCEREACEDARAHCVFLFGADAFQAVISQRTKQTFAGRHLATVDQSPKFRIEIEHVPWQRPA
jgi:hypothetical protein